MPTQVIDRFVCEEPAEAERRPVSKKILYFLMTFLFFFLDTEWAILYLTDNNAAPGLGNICTT